MKKVAWFLFFTVLAVSCLDEPDCYNLNNSIVGISFRKMADNKADTLTLAGVRISGSDSVFYSYSRATGVMLPLNVLTDEAEIEFQQLDGITQVARKLVLGYVSKVQFVSKDCGERFIVSGLHPIFSDFDSVRVLNGSPTKNPTTNVVLYRCPVTNSIRFGFRQWYADNDSVGHPRDVYLDGISADYSNEVFYADDTVSTVVLPLNASAGSTQFDFDFVEGLNSVTIDYRAIDKVLFDRCGQQRLLAGLQVQSTDFAAAKLLRDSIQDPPVTNVAFYRCPDTNLVKIAFKALADEGAPDVQVPITRITADYTTAVFYSSSNVSSVTLPVNDQADITRFTIEFASGAVNLELGYSRAPVVYHEVCNRISISSLEVISSGFTTPPQVLHEELSFPADATNLAVTIN